MSKREYVLRYLSIIKKLRNNHEASFEEIVDFLKIESEFHGYNLTISKRTFSRDISEIRSLFNIDILFNFNRNVFFISDDSEQAALGMRMLEAFDLFNTLNTAGDLNRHIYFEKRMPQGMEHFYGLLHTIKNCNEIRFTYQKYWDGDFSQRTTEPYALKEFKGRWYILAKDQTDGKIKTFGLDRISELEITKKKFVFPKKLDVYKIFRDCFGIICPHDSKPEEVVLSFDSVQGKYIKSFPLHESQEITEENKKELRVKLRLHITHDFIMELLSYGNGLKVILPAKLKNQLCKLYSKSLKQYEVLV